MAIEIHVWKLTGLSPLLQSNGASLLESQDQGGMTTGKKVYIDAEEAEMRVYRENGCFAHPTTAIRAALLSACTNRKINKKAAKGIIAGAVFPVEQWMRIDDAEGKPFAAYEMFACRAVVGKNGIRRVFPMFRNWTALLPLEIDRDLIMSIDDITSLLDIAGRIVGIGQLRPDTTRGKNGVGTYGRFRAKLVETAKAPESTSKSRKAV